MRGHEGQIPYYTLRVERLLRCFLIGLLIIGAGGIVELFVAEPAGLPA
jgi:hypothetical protein